MSKNINIAAHVKRYEETEIADILQLINALTELAESRKESDITMLEEKLAMLKRGEVPPATAPVTITRTRGGKKNTSTSTESA